MLHQTQKLFRNKNFFSTQELAQVIVLSSLLIGSALLFMKRIPSDWISENSWLYYLTENNDSAEFVPASTIQRGTSVVDAFRTTGLLEGQTYVVEGNTSFVFSEKSSLIHNHNEMADYLKTQGQSVFFTPVPNTNYVRVKIQDLAQLTSKVDTHCPTPFPELISPLSTAHPAEPHPLVRMRTQKINQTMVPSIQEIASIPIILPAPILERTHKSSQFVPCGNESECLEQKNVSTIVSMFAEKNGRSVTLIGRPFPVYVNIEHLFERDIKSMAAAINEATKGTVRVTVNEKSIILKYQTTETVNDTDPNKDQVQLVVTPIDTSLPINNVKTKNRLKKSIL